MPLILVLYVDDLFLTGDERPWVDALLSGLGGLVERLMLLHWTWEVCIRDHEEIQDGGL